MKTLIHKWIERTLSRKTVAYSVVWPPGIGEAKEDSAAHRSHSSEQPLCSHKCLYFWDLFPGYKYGQTIDQICTQQPGCTFTPIYLPSALTGDWNHKPQACRWLPSTLKKFSNFLLFRINAWFRSVNINCATQLKLRSFLNIYWCTYNIKLIIWDFPNQQKLARNILYKYIYV